MASQLPESTESLGTGRGVREAVRRDRTSAEARVGSVLAQRFELVRVLGVGSYGDVYEVRDLQSPSMPLALKLLRRPGANALYRFKREFRGLAEVAHPNLAALYELFLDDGGAFFTMELVPGGDMLTYVRSGGLDASRLWKALQGLVDGVSALHELGWLHCDLKPGNVMVDDRGRVVIVDFGLATLLGEGSVEAPMAGFAGTPGYASPEQLAGRPVGPESDWYAVGTLLYQALSGRLPYEVPFSELARAKLEPPAALPALPASLSVLGVLCRRMLAPQPHARAGVAELRVRLGGSAAPTRSAQRTASEPVFVGRRAELAQLTESFARVEQGGRACAVVLAPSGLGKTVLVETFLSELRTSQRALVLSGRCYVNEDISYRAVDGLVDSLSHHLLGLPSDEAAALVPVDSRALAQLFPILMRVSAIAALDIRRVSDAESETSARDRGLRALRELLARLSDRLPLVLFIDDVQWDDEDSAWLIAELLADPGPPSLLLVLACRSDESNHSHVLRALRSDPCLSGAMCEVSLAPLSHHDTQTLAATVIASRDSATVEALLARIAEESNGHPMFAIELARWASDTSTLSLDAAIRSRSAGLPASALRLLELTCAAGHRLTLSMALRACGAERGSVRELVARKLVSCTGFGGYDTLEAYHDRVREALLEAVPAERVRALRCEVAGALSHEPVPRFDLVVEHFLAAGLPARAAVHALDAADQAAAVLAFHRVPSLIQLAIAHAAHGAPDARCALYVRLGQACSLVGRTRDAAQALRDAAELESDPGKRWELERMAMWQALQGRDLELAMPLLKRLDRAFGAYSVRPTPWRVMASATQYLWWMLVGLPTLRVPRDSARSAFDAMRLSVIWSATTGFPRERMLWLAHFMVIGLRLSARLGDASVYPTMLAGLTATGAALAGRPRPSAEAGMARSLALARAHGDTSSVQHVLLSQVIYLALTTQVERAMAALDAALDLPFATSDVGTNLKLAARLSCPPRFFWYGSLGRMRGCVDAWIREAREHADPYFEYGLRGLAAYRFLCDDDAEQALSEWLLAQREFPDHGAMREPIWGIVIGLYAGRIYVAADALAHGKRTFWRWDAFPSQTRAVHLWAHGAIAAAGMTAGDRDVRARRALRWAIWSLRLQRALLARPMLQHLLAVRAFLHGKRAAGIAHLETAHAGYAELGLRLFAACAQHALSRMHPDERERERHLIGARTLFEAEGLRRPDRWERALLPGLPEASRP